MSAMPRVILLRCLVVIAVMTVGGGLRAWQADVSALDVVTVVGHWERAVQAGEPVVTADPRKWDGKSGPDLAAVSRTLFKAPLPVFAKNSSPATAFPLAVVKGVDDFTGGTLSANFKLVAGPTDQTAGIAFGIGPAADYFYARYNTKDGNVAVWEFVNGERRVLAHGAEHKQLPLDTWHELTITVSGRTVTAVAGPGGSLKVTHQLPRDVSGRVGFWTKRDAVSAFKDLRITPAR